MKTFCLFFESIAALTLMLGLTGCYPSATLQVEKDIPAPPTRPISLTLEAAKGVELSAEDMTTLRAILVDCLAWEGGLIVGSKNQLKVIGTVTQYDPGVPLLRPLAPGLFD